jgi:uncharacterized cupredoxin-like copper-binding protein
MPPAPTAAATPAPSPDDTLARARGDLTDMMTIEPAAAVAASTPITFVVTNIGQITHEFTLGDAHVQDEHEQK